MPPRSRNVIRVDVTGIKGIAKALGSDIVYREALQRVIERTTEAGAKRVESFVPERTGKLRGAIRRKYFAPSGSTKPQMGSVSAGAGVTDEGFRYGWALNYAKRIRGKSSDGYRYSDDGVGNSKARSGRPTYHWMSRAIPTMKATIRRSVAKETKNIEAKFASVARSLP